MRLRLPVPRPIWGGSPRRSPLGARRDRYRCSLPGLTGLAARRREGTGADHHGSVAERVGFEPTNTREDVTGIPVQRLRPLGHLSIQHVTTTYSSLLSPPDTTRERQKPRFLPRPRRGTQTQLPRRLVPPPIQKTRPRIIHRHA